jgi:hypothetical protein
MAGKGVPGQHAEMPEPCSGGLRVPSSQSAERRAQSAEVGKGRWHVARRVSMELVSPGRTLQLACSNTHEGFLGLNPRPNACRWGPNEICSGLRGVGRVVLLGDSITRAMTDALFMTIRQDAVSGCAGRVQGSQLRVQIMGVPCGSAAASAHWRPRVWLRRAPIGGRGCG